MTRLLTPSIVALLMRFSQLPSNEQSHFLDMLNAYLYASPQRRSRLRMDWMEACQPREDCPDQQRAGDCSPCNANGAGRRRCG